jgi:hypothetical protein
MLRQEVKQMRGQLEVLGNEVQMSGKRQRDMYVDLDSRLKRFEQTGAAAPAAEPPRREVRLVLGPLPGVHRRPVHPVPRRP